MKMAKIFALMFALFLAVFCLSGTFAMAGDAHPWDEEGGGGGDDDGDLDGTVPEDPNTDIPKTIGNYEIVPDDGSTILDLLRFSLIVSMTK